MIKTIAIIIGVILIAKALFMILTPKEVKRMESWFTRDIKRMRIIGFFEFIAGISLTIYGRFF